MKENTYVKIFASIIDDNAKEQIELIKESPAIRGKVAIMPDVHSGAGCVIGFTSQVTDKIIPNIIGVDIGCGVLAYNLGKRDIDFEAFDKHVRATIPLGFKHNSLEFSNDLSVKLNRTNLDLRNDIFKVDGNIDYKKNMFQQIGTLGGGNHFIEVAIDEEENKWLLIHTGSRNFGLSVALYHQKKAEKICKAMGLNDIPKGLEYLPMDFGGKEYLSDMKVAQKFARLNRLMILENILKFFDVGVNPDNIIESVHNYIDDKDMMRKGAISAHKGEKVIIPMNMAEGSIIGVGKGNSEYNYSAPHGAGRIHGRKDMFRRLDIGEFTMKDFEDSMKDVFSTSICEKTFDESKFAYKQFSDIEEHLKETVEIIHRLTPVYNLKSD